MSFSISRHRFVLVALFLATPLVAQESGAILADLIEANDRVAALERIDAGADVNAPQSDGTRPIHWAVYRVDYELLEALIARGADLDVRNTFGATPIAQAAGIGDLRMVDMLIGGGADPDGANPDGQTALMLAIRTGEIEVVRSLIDAGADVNAAETFRNQTPLMWAATSGPNAGEMVRMLIDAGADVTPRAMYIDWPTQITAEPRAQYRPVGGLTALLYAARDGCADCVEALLDAGADIDRPTPEGVTPLLIALDNDHYEVAELLLDRGANPGLWDWWGRTALYVTVDRQACDLGSGRNCGRVNGASTARMAIVESLLAAGVDPNPQLNFHRPSRGGNSGRFVDPLLGTGATPLSRATMAGDVELVRALLDAGGDPNINVMGLTPFLIAAGVGPGHVGGTGLAAETSAGGPVNVELMELLLAHGADVNDQITGTTTYSMRITRAPSRNEGRTALHIAAEEGDVDRVRYLLEQGADPAITDPEGLRASDLVAVDAEAADEIRNLLGTVAPVTR